MMHRTTLPSLLFVFLTALNCWSAERKMLTPPLMPPEFPQSPFGFNRGDERRGESLYRKNGCPSCHMIDGKGGKLGPDLSRIGETKTLPGWYRQHLANSHKPPFAFPDRDMDDLIAYLQNLKLLR